MKINRNRDPCGILIGLFKKKFQLVFLFSVSSKSADEPTGICRRKSRICIAIIVVIIFIVLVIIPILVWLIVRNVNEQTG